MRMPLQFRLSRIFLLQFLAAPLMLRLTPAFSGSIAGVLAVTVIGTGFVLLMDWFFYPAGRVAKSPFDRSLWIGLTAGLGYAALTHLSTMFFESLMGRRTLMNVFEVFSAILIVSIVGVILGFF